MHAALNLHSINWWFFLCRGLVFEKKFHLLLVTMNIINFWNYRERLAPAREVVHLKPNWNVSRFFWCSFVQLSWLNIDIFYSGAVLFYGAIRKSWVVCTECQVCHNRSGRQNAGNDTGICHVDRQCWKTNSASLRSWWNVHFLHSYHHLFAPKGVHRTQYLRACYTWRQVPIFHTICTCIHFLRLLIPCVYTV